MIRTLGFFSGIVITGTAIVLFSDFLFSNTSAMQSTPDSLRRCLFRWLIR